MVFPVVMYGCESWAIKKAERRRIDAFELWCWRRLLKSPSDIVNKAEVDVFLELSCFFHDPGDVANLISGSSAFSKTSLNIRKFTVHILLKPGLENFEPLDCKEIQPVHSEGDQPWDFFGRNDAEAETPVLWPPHAKR